MIPFPFARPASHPAPPRPQPGAAARVTVNAHGFAHAGVPQRGKYPHPFRPELGGRSIRFARGLINEQFEPKIKGVPMSGTDRQPAPALTLDPSVANDRGESWCCVEVEPDEHGELTAKSRIAIVHTATPRSLDPKIGRKALVQILWRKKVPFQAFEIVYFNLDYTRILPAPGGGAVRHLFL